MSFGILVTNYNTWSLTAECIKNCFNFADSTIDKFIVIDDCSTEQIDNQFSQIRLIQNRQNLGLVRSLNVGLEFLDTDLIVIFDSDAYPLENFVLKTKEYFDENPLIGIASFQTEKHNGAKIDSFEPEPTALSLILGQQLFSYYRKIFQKNPVNITVYTCAMVIRNEVLREIGTFDENYDWLELDHDLCMRATRKGWNVGVMPIRAFHKGSGTPQKVSHRVVRFYKNRIKLLRKFKKYPMEQLLNTIIIFRLLLEFIVINTVGRFKYNQEYLRDKSFSRITLIKLFFTGNI